MAESEYRVTDNRSSARRNGRDLILGESVSEAKQASSAKLPKDGQIFSGLGDSNPFTRAQGDDDVVAEMAKNRRVAMKKQGSAGGGGASIQFATGRPRDPMFYWRQNNIPFDVYKKDEIQRVREFCRLLYMTHPIVSACIDIFSKFPLQGMRLECKDEQLKDFYEDLFFDQLDYENYLLDMGREYWTVGEAWPLGSFNEDLGVWDDDELLNANDVEVERSPFLREPRFLIRLPETLRKIITERSPRWEYDALMRSYPELQAYAGEDTLMPVSNILLKQLKFKGDTFHPRGVPILLRGFRAIVQEEMLMSAMDAIADRLYTPLILAKLGASASDLGTDTPWVPTQDDLEDFNEALDAALSGDFRVLTHHFATDMEPVFGRENMPDMSQDFDRIEERIMQVFGLSKTMLSGAGQGETYAADALNRDIVSQLLTHYQKMLKNFARDRMLVVAEAQEHFDYDVRNGKRYVKMEEVLEVDEETGEQRIVEQPQLLVPELTFESMTLADEQTERQFIEGLAQAGVPVPYKRRLFNMDLDFDQMLEERQAEQVSLVVAEAETRRETYKALRDAGLPIPQDLIDDFRPKAANAQQTAGAEHQMMPMLGADGQTYPALSPDVRDMWQQQMSGREGLDANGNPLTDAYGGQLAPGDQGQVAPVQAPSTQPQLPGQAGTSQRPPESDEQRAAMPKPPKNEDIGVKKVPRTSTLQKEAHYEVEPQIRKVTKQHYVAPDNTIEHDVDEDGEVLATNAQNYRPTGRFGAPRHLGMRRHVEVPESEKWGHWESEDEEE